MQNAELVIYASFSAKALPGKTARGEIYSATKNTFTFIFYLEHEKAKKRSFFTPSDSIEG